jgi:hypothetical protein
MASVSQLNPYHCDHCGTANIVAAPVLYQRGTRNYSTRFRSGTAQSFSAQAAAPPRLRGYIQPLVLWSPLILLLSTWTLVGLRSVFQFHQVSISRVDMAVVILLLDLASIGGLLFNLRKVVHFNREVYPHLQWNWEHTYICRRCGRSRLIPS